MGNIESMIAIELGIPCSPRKKEKEIELKDISDEALFNRHYRGLHQDYLKISEDFIHDGQPILRNARIIECITFGYNSITNECDKQRFLRIAKNRLIEKIKENFAIFADVHGISTSECILRWKDKFAQKFPKLVYLIKDLHKEVEIEEWQQWSWNTGNEVP